MAEEQFLFRDIFSRERITYIGDRIAAAWPQFDLKGFVSTATDGLDALSYGDRAKKIRDALGLQLPTVFAEAADILVNALGPEPEIDEIKGFEGFYVMPLAMYVSEYGMEDPDAALHALYEMTKRFTAEGDIRPFLIRYPDKTLAFLRRLTADPSPFARRLASEGTRPRLPLSARLPEFQRDPAPVIELLDRLFSDENLMVRRSVANNINDIAKDNPGIAVATLARWKAEADGGATEQVERTDWLIRHGLRTLFKQDHPGALSLLGYESDGVTVDGWSMDPRRVSLGGSIRFSISLRSSATDARKVALNYVIAFRKANGQNKDKVFRLRDQTLSPGAATTVEKTHHLKPFKNQVFYSGTQFLEVRVNGQSAFRVPFEMEVVDE